MICFSALGHEQAFHHILHILPDQFLQPRQRFVGPTLGVNGEHDLVGEAVFGGGDQGGWFCLLGFIGMPAKQSLQNFHDELPCL